jgi:hypothetical protein
MCVGLPETCVCARPPVLSRVVIGQQASRDRRLIATVQVFRNTRRDGPWLAHFAAAHDGWHARKLRQQRQGVQLLVDESAVARARSGGVSLHAPSLQLGVAAFGIGPRVPKRPEVDPE